MNSRRLLPSLLAAALLCALGLIAAPTLYGGGGDDGVDILPRGGSGDGTRGGRIGSGSGNTGLTAPELGYVTIHSNGKVLLEAGTWSLPGLVTGPHRSTDIFLGLPGQEPIKNLTALDVFAKGNRFISQTALGKKLHLGGRFEFEDLDPNDGESLELIGHFGKAATYGVIVGTRSTHDGRILPSFSSIDWVFVDRLPGGILDLRALRDAMISELGGSGHDVGVAVATMTPYGTRVVWAAFNVDDARAIYDVDAPLR